jgi:hypothetical protein
VAGPASVPSNGIRDAKEFVVAEIVEQARLEGSALSEVERKMLYFSESGWALPDMAEVADAFHRAYGDDDYERKIARLIRAARKRTGGKNVAAWMHAVAVLSKGDHYLLVMINQAGSGEDRHVSWRAFPVVLAIGCIYALFQFLLSRYLGHDVEHDLDVVFIVWAAAALATVTFLLLRFLFGAGTVDRIVNKVLGAFFGARRP